MPATTITAISAATKKAFHENVEAIFKVIVFAFNEQWWRAVLWRFFGQITPRIV
jgi:hypothetical protein